MHGASFSSAVVWRAFARLQYFRFLFRLRLAVYAAVPAAFWTGVALLGIAADRVRLAPFVVAGAVVWTLAMVPHLIVQFTVIFDALGYAFTRRVRIYTFLRDCTPALEDAPETRIARRAARILRLFGMASPFNAVAFWCFGVLLRAPAAAYAGSLAKASSPARRRAQLRRPPPGPFAGRLRREMFLQFGATAPEELAFI
ncbi:MAG: hypothetical protein JO306_00510 [Gemmatimonadetes bacterium]|nr:hypothetical protein [Gemmatimonadota bacterium]